MCHVSGSMFHVSCLRKSKPEIGDRNSKLENLKSRKLNKVKGEGVRENMPPQLLQLITFIGSVTRNIHVRYLSEEALIQMIWPQLDFWIDSVDLDPLLDLTNCY